MKNREVTIAVCGAVFGILLGSIASNFSSPMQGDLTGGVAYIPFHLAPDAEDYSRRNIDEKAIELMDNKGAIPNYPTLKPSADAASSAVSSVDNSACGMVKRAIAKVRAVYNTAIPTGNIRYTEIRAKMEAGFKDALAECADPVTTTTSALSTSSFAPAKAAVDNNCERFSVRSVRYTQCQLAEREGKTYP
jgi:hypothetical protein